MYRESRPFFLAAQGMLDKMDKANEKGRFEKKVNTVVLVSKICLNFIFSKIKNFERLK